MRPSLYLQRPEDSKKQARMIRMQIWMYPDANPNVSFCEKIEKCVFYRHPKGVWPKSKRRKFGHFKVPFSTPKVPNGSLGCQTHFRVQVCFGLSFQGFLIWSSHLEVFSSLVYDFYCYPIIPFIPTCNPILNNNYQPIMELFN